MEGLLVSLVIITMDTEAGLNPGEQLVITSLWLRQHHYPSCQGAGISSSGYLALKGSGLVDL